MKGEYSIVVTDSGLGGLSVMAELEKNLRDNPVAENIRLTFFNSVINKKYGYNNMGSEEEKAGVFNSALESMARLYKPDIIFIACNTLSIVYPQTKFAVETEINVLSIVDFGVDLVYKSLAAETGSAAILLGTPTTINSGVHKKRLLQRGISTERIVEQPCFMLESEIQDDPHSEATRNLIKKFLTEAGDKLNAGYNKIYAAFYCTHYGYSSALFEEEMKKIFSCPVGILNPNSSMSTYFNKDTSSKQDNTQIKCEVVSRVPIMNEEIKTLGELIKIISPSVFESFSNFHHKPDLF